MAYVTHSIRKRGNFNSERKTKKSMLTSFFSSIKPVFAMLVIVGIGLNASGQSDDTIKELRELNESVVTLHKSGDFDKAAKAAEEALAITARVFGPESLDAAVVHTNLAVIQRDRKKFKESIRNFEKAISIREKLGGKEIDDMTGAIEALAGVQLLAGKAKDSEASYKRALEIYERSYGKLSKESLAAVLNLASFYSKTDQFAEADELYLQALKIASEKFGYPSREVELVDTTRGCLTLIPKMPASANSAYDDARKAILKNSDDADVILDGKALHLPRPRYPDEARTRYLGGIILVRVKINESGNVSEARAVCGPDILQRVAEQSAMGARFTPTLRNGVPIEVSGMITFTFLPPGSR